MFELVYKRKEADVIDLKIFWSTIELENWLRKENKLEAIDILDVRKARGS